MSGQGGKRSQGAFIISAFLFVPDTLPVAYDSKQENTVSRFVNPKAWAGLPTVIDVTDDRTHPSKFQIFYCLTHTV